MSDIKAMGAQVVQVVRDYCARAIDPLSKRLDDIEKDLRERPRPKDGKDVDPEVVRALVVEQVQQAVKDLPPPKDGRDADPEVIREMVKSAFDAMPKPADGKDADADAIATQVLEKVIAGLEKIPPSKDGKDADPELIKSAVAAEVDRAVKALPPAEKGEPGESVDLVALAGQISAAAAAAVAALPKPADGKDADPELLKQTVLDAVAKLPPPRDGKDAEPVTVEMLEPIVKRAVDEALEARRPTDEQRGLAEKDMESFVARMKELCESDETVCG